MAGTPCYDFVVGAATPNLGILQPAGLVHIGTQYQLDTFIVDQNYTGTCTYTFRVTRQSTVLYTAITSFSETAPTTVLIGTALTIPTGTAVGSATLSNTAVCGTSTTKSASGIYTSTKLGAISVAQFTNSWG